jgi:uncharacterized membrane protein
VVNVKRRERDLCKSCLSYNSGKGQVTFIDVLYKALEYVVIFLLGGFIYYSAEMICRGHSHWSMFIVGGLCLVIIGLLNEGCFPENFGIIPQCIMGAVIITFLELISGIVVNLWLGWDVWDYSNMPLNVMGQICLPFTLLWVVLAGVAIVVDDFFRWLLFGEPWPQYYWIKAKK